ncbi:MAG: GEVED domain-containing protein, partial [Bacteroidota bacterium]
MMKTLRTALPKAFMAVTIALLFLVGSPQLDAQPTNYCIPSQPELASGGYYYCYPEYLPSISNYYDWYYPAMVTHVKVYNQALTPIDRQSSNDLETGFEGCWVDTGVEGELEIDADYSIYVKVKEAYYSYNGNDYCEMYNYSTYYTTRVFIDWNADGDFEDEDEWINNDFSNHVNLENNHPSNNFRWRYNTSCQNETEFLFHIHVPADVEPGKRVMRVMHSYYYPYAPYYDPANACFNGYYDRFNTPPRYAYGYGEVEDYVVDFQLGFEDIFPDNDDILFADQLYNGETRTFRGQQVHFEKPFVEFGNPNPEGTTMKFEIQGPLPSDNIVYTGLDENGDDLLDISGGSENRVLFEMI